MVKKEAIIHDPIGLHLRPATNFCKKAMEFPCRVKLQMNHTIVNGKSVLGILALGAKKGTKIIIMCEGEEEAEAARVLTELIESVD